jgi:hypothetical protein
MIFAYTNNISLPPVRILLFFVSVVGLFSCSKEVSSSGSTMILITNPIPVMDSTLTDSTLYIDITLDGNRILRIENGEQGPLAWGTEFGLSTADSSVYGYNRLGSSFVSPTSLFEPSFYFGKGNVDFPEVRNSDLLPGNFTDSFFAPGNYNYSIKTGDTSFNYLGSPSDTVTKFANTLIKTLLSPGINLSWLDSAGTFWETINGTADQTGSFFTITASHITTLTLASKPQGSIVTAKFDCLLYDNKGHSMHLTNGQFRLWVVY